MECCWKKLTFIVNWILTRAPRNSKGERTVFSTSGAGTTLDPFFTPYTKLNPKWIKHLNVIAKTMEVFIGINLYDLGLGKAFIDNSIKSMSGKKNKSKLDLMKVKNIKKWKDSPWNERKVLYIIYLIRDLFLEYIRNS